MAITVQVLRGKYCNSKRGPEIFTKRKGDSRLWINTCRMWNTLDDSSIWEIGNGSHILFCNVKWQGEGCNLIELVTSEVLAGELNKKVADYEPPEEGWIKINTDGVARGNPSPATYRGLAQNHASCSTMIAEFWGIIKSQDMAWAGGWRKVIIESDSSNAVAVLTKNGEAARESYLVSRIRGNRKLEKVEASLAKARALIREASLRTNDTVPPEDTDYVPHGDIYRNAFAFHRSYQLMEKLFKIFVYEEGEPPLFHYGPCKNIYSMEGIFINLLESNNLFRTQNPDEAYVYFLPFSVVMILEHLFHPVIRDKAVLGRTIGDYVHIISHKYSYWNRSYGADHFMLSCHDWGPRATWYVKELYFIAIRVLCNANVTEHFNPKKDASFPEINLVTGGTTGLFGGYPPSNRTILAFFAGQRHGRIRPVLFQHWENKDKDVLVYEKLPNGVSYHETMKMSKYCICPSGFEVASPRIVEAIYAQCVPVIISQQYVLPFSDVLNWDSFSVQIPVSDIPKLKEILLGISEDKYMRLQGGVKQVQRHFVVNNPPKRYDVFHMIIHSIWLRRLNVHVK
ncbi:probable glycosyltransferase At3g07620 [Gastrolobium bilobum]|uniref:probable glycosyltransferase At3g07620 n=1 Tax=Gastrolobium bilobum TaxID=150636 RepID=UPI002AAF9D08|nr:probable glycosyltransferase At3g07620 [Gastrolobium bilobum]